MIFSNPRGMVGWCGSDLLFLAMIASTLLVSILGFSDSAHAQQHQGQRGYFMQKDTPRIQKASINKEPLPVKRSPQNRNADANSRSRITDGERSASAMSRPTAPTRDGERRSARDVIRDFNWMNRNRE